MTLATFKQELYTQLESHYPKTELDSFFNILLQDILGISKIDAILSPQLSIPEQQSHQLMTILQGLTEQQPIQHLIGFIEFMDLKFNVNSHVLIPRPETEELIRWIIEDFTPQQKTEILDIGTGTGCIPICLAKNLRNAHITTIDVSEKAIETAKINATKNKVQVHFLHQNILTTSNLPQQYDVIVSNPPYVRNLEKKKMQKNVLNYEPHLALFVEDNNPLIFYKKIAELALTSLKPKGILYFEINQYLGKETVDLLYHLGFKNVELRKDVFGNYRMTKAST
ncbi:peptide chain release factor N(5)-glutamine methyltransferase [Ochrovirga pacifica]|uniref:peptide chain release factor N(5)-glutamine methyltransferase n=1 Tax=Ochrovirga pacifica TaxID=1042376 RepID=UPI0002559220|nr:peptide chain release factor N(5)-glutamine methyltransferase [Ochrovirga pacifica]